MGLDVCSVLEPRNKFAGFTCEKNPCRSDLAVELEETTGSDPLADSGAPRMTGSGATCVTSTGALPLGADLGLLFVDGSGLARTVVLVRVAVFADRATLAAEGTLEGVAAGRDSAAEGLISCSSARTTASTASELVGGGFSDR